MFLPNMTPFPPWYLLITLQCICMCLVTSFNIQFTSWSYTELLQSFIYIGQIRIINHIAHLPRTIHHSWIEAPVADFLSPAYSSWRISLVFRLTMPSADEFTSTVLFAFFATLDRIRQSSTSWSSSPRELMVRDREQLLPSMDGADGKEGKDISSFLFPILGVSGSWSWFTYTFAYNSLDFCSIRFLTADCCNCEERWISHKAIQWSGDHPSEQS